MHPLVLFLCLWFGTSFSLDAQPTDSVLEASPRCLELRESIGPLFEAEEQDPRVLIPQLLAIYKDIQNCAGDFLIVVDLNLAKNYTRLGKYDSCLYYANHALELYQNDTTVLNLDQAASVYSFVGSAHFQQQQYTTCLEYELKTLKLRETHQLDALGHTYENIANTYMELKDYNKALSYFHLAGNYFKEKEDPENLAYLHLNLGNAYSKMHNLIKAQDYLQLAMEYARSTSDEWLEMDVLRVLTTIDDELQNHLLLLEHARRGIELAVELQDSLGLLELYNNRMLAYTQLKQWKEAQNNRQIVESLIQQVGSAFERSVYYENLVPYFVGQEQYDSAALYFQRFQTIEDSLKEAAVAETVAKLETHYETEKKAQRIEFLEFEQAERTQRERLYWVIGGLLILLVCVLGWLYRLRTQRNHKLQALNTLKDQFFGILAHDLKTPLVSFRSITEALQMHHATLPVERVHYFLDQMHHASHQLYDLLQNLLQWALSQTGRLRYVPQSLDMVQEVQKTIHLLQPTATLKAITLTPKLPPKLTLWADSQLTQTVIRNLLDNAIKFTPSGGQVWITAEPAGLFWRLSISDTGPGMSAEQQAALFKGALHTGPKVTGSGTGLGLVLCRELIERQGGTIGVKSTLGKGSQFWFTLPISSSDQK